MTDSITIGADGQANQTLDLLRAEQRTGELGTEAGILPGLGFHADPELNLSGSWTTEPGRLLDIQADVPGIGGWAGLHLSLPIASTRGRGIIGFAARLQAPEIFVARACLRSGREGGFVDCFFEKHLLFTPDETSHVDVLQIAHRDTIPEEAPWRDLILFLPTESFRLSLIDWRVFAV
ncbi:hypothetical protein [Salipiger aestuarii]|uniref:hypothetical protein n=1 Tax=Salipiger aestuarii TaxID=568098 RepID=UPI00123C5F3B|nr:hypothetical protein [Salipiger aestuarii]KAA8610029.1 hypothetical protein AL037_14350 [Salipiger aestuarii]